MVRLAVLTGQWGRGKFIRVANFGDRAPEGRENNQNANFKLQKMIDFRGESGDI